MSAATFHVHRRRAPAPVAIEQAAPELLESLQLALPAMRRQRDTLIEIGGSWDDSPTPSRVIDPELQEEFAELEAAIETGELALLKASAPWPKIPAADQARILQRFPAPIVEAGNG